MRRNISAIIFLFNHVELFLPNVPTYHIMLLYRGYCVPCLRNNCSVFPMCGTKSRLDFPNCALIRLSFIRELCLGFLFFFHYHTYHTVFYLDTYFRIAGILMLYFRVSWLILNLLSYSTKYWKTNIGSEKRGNINAIIVRTYMCNREERLIT